MEGYINNIQETSKVVEAQWPIYSTLSCPKKSVKRQSKRYRNNHVHPLYRIAILPCLSTRRENPGFLKTGGKTKRQKGWIQTKLGI